MIRKTIGFDGLLMTDDLDMKALSGDIGDLAAQSQAAGCDVVLNCWGKMSDMESIVKKNEVADTSDAHTNASGNRLLGEGDEFSDD